MIKGYGFIDHLLQKESDEHEKKTHIDIGDYFGWMFCGE